MFFLSIALKLIVGLIALIIVIRVVGKKALSQITPFDLVYALVLGGILEESIYDDKVSIFHVLFALAVWGSLIYGIEVMLQKREKAARRVKGKASLLIFQGILNLKEFERNHVEMEQLRTMLREQGIFSLREVDYLLLEPDGQPTLMKKAEVAASFSYLVIDEGEVEENTLATLGKKEAWLRAELQKAGLPDAREIVYGEWSEEQGLYCLTYADCLNRTIIIDG